MELKNITRYYPENMPYGNNVQYFQSEDGFLRVPAIIHQKI